MDKGTLGELSLLCAGPSGRGQGDLKGKSLTGSPPQLLFSGFYTACFKFLTVSMFSLVGGHL